MNIIETCNLSLTWFCYYKDTSKSSYLHLASQAESAGKLKPWITYLALCRVVPRLEVDGSPYGEELRVVVSLSNVSV
jgi:hypothetical protein